MLVVKNPSASAGDVRDNRFLPWVGKIPQRRKGHPTPLCLPESPMDRGAWKAAVLRVSESDMTEVTVQGTFDYKLF